MERDLDAAVAGNLLKGIKRAGKDTDVAFDLDDALDDAWIEKDYIPPEHRHLPRIQRPAWRAAMEAMAAAHITKVSQDYAALVYSRCQSPVEELLFLALAIHASGMYATEFRYPSPYYSPQLCCGRIPHTGRSIHVCPQHASGQLHVDFMVTFIDYPLPTADKDGKHVEEEWPTAQVMVEVDGHDFHEKTKEQARRDKKRDRELLKLGFPVLRYTGSEVWADPMACASDVIEYLEKRLAPDGAD